MQQKARGFVFINTSHFTVYKTRKLLIMFFTLQDVQVGLKLQKHHERLTSATTETA